MLMILMMLIYWMKHKYHKEKLRSLLDASEEVGLKVNTGAGLVLSMGEMRNPYKVLVEKPEVKRPLGRPRHRWEDIKMDLKDVGWEGMD
jgi:hypothetical protein